MKRTLEILNELERTGVLSRYAIGGAMGATFYVEPLLTFDLDVFVVLPHTAGGLVTLAPLYEALRRRGYAEDGDCVNIEGVPVQFLPAYNALLEEALREARETVNSPPTTTTATRFKGRAFTGARYMRWRNSRRCLALSALPLRMFTAMKDASACSGSSSGAFKSNAGANVLKPATDAPGFLLQPPGDACFLQVVGRHLHFHPVADGKTHPTLAHLAADGGQHEVLVFQFHPEHRARQHGHDATFDFNMFFFHGLIE